MRPVLIGGIAALALIAAALVAIVSGVLPIGSQETGPSQLLVIATAPDQDGVEVASFAFVIDRATDSVLLVDTWAPVSVAGTTARTARDAYPFGGGDGVAKALAPQTGGDPLPWIVLPAEAWSSLIDDAGSVPMEVPEGVSVYRSGELIVLESGTRRLAGRELVALASSLDYLDDASSRAKIAKQINAAVSAAASAGTERLTGLVTEGSGKSSISAGELRAFFSEQ